MGVEFAIGLFQPIPREAWDACWFDCGVNVAGHMRVALLRWGLVETVIVLPDETVIPAVGISEISFWAGLDLWQSLDPDACAGGCQKAVYW